MQLDPSSVITLVFLAQSGDREALNQLLSDIQDGLYSYLVPLVDDKHLAEDILQEVFVLVWRKLFLAAGPRSLSTLGVSDCEPGSLPPAEEAPLSGPDAREAGALGRHTCPRPPAISPGMAG
jgi:hypothetical protein